jgi:hypothetical protein
VARCGLITRGVVAFGELSQFGACGAWGRPWLVGWDGGDCGRGPVDGCLSQEGWQLQVINVYCKNRYIYIYIYMHVSPH